MGLPHPQAHSSVFTEKTSHIVFAREGLVKCVWWLSKVQDCLGLVVGDSVLVATLAWCSAIALERNGPKVYRCATLQGV